MNFQLNAFVIFQVYISDLIFNGLLLTCVKLAEVSKVSIFKTYICFDPVIVPLEIYHAEWQRRAQGCNRTLTVLHTTGNNLGISHK